MNLRSLCSAYFDVLARGDQAEVLEDQVAAREERGLLRARARRAARRPAGRSTGSWSRRGRSSRRRSRSRRASRSASSGSLDVAVADHRDRQRLLEPGDLVPLRAGVAGEHLARGAGVQRDRRRRRSPRRSRPSSRKFLRSWSRPSRNLTVSGIEIARRTVATIALGELEVAHQRAARAALEDLVGRAAHVDVADVGAHRLDQARRLGHGVGVGAVDLDRDRTLLGRRSASGRASARRRAPAPARR